MNKDPIIQTLARSENEIASRLQKVVDTGDCAKTP